VIPSARIQATAGQNRRRPVIILCGIVGTTLCAFGYVWLLLHDQPWRALLYAVCVVVNVHSMLVGFGWARIPYWISRRIGRSIDVQFELQVYLPLAADHPLVQHANARCPICHEIFKMGDVTTVIPVPLMPAHFACVKLVIDSPTYTQ
jgi:hypothetical protein